MTLRDDDELIEVKLTDDTTEVMMVTKLGMCIRFKATDVRPTGRSAMGVIGMNLMDTDEVVGVQLNNQGNTMLIVSENGMGKKTDINEYAVQHRGGKGVKCYKITEKTGNVIGAKAVDDTREVMLITTEGIIIRLACRDISTLGRITSGVKLINLDEGVKVATVSKVRKNHLMRMAVKPVMKMVILKKILQQIHKKMLWTYRINQLTDTRRGRKRPAAII